MNPPTALSAGERVAWLRLARSEGVGPLTFRGLVQRFGSASAALEALPGLSRRRGRAITPASADEAGREIERAAARGWRFVALDEPDYPPPLCAIDGAPPLICVAGDPAVLQRPMVAVVGARNASGTGLLFTERLALGLGGAGFVVVSGLARGIDARAHKAALATGTVAVLAGGLDRIYPPEHGTLAERIAAEGGAVISEMPLGWEPRGRDFPRRNRIVSGLSLGTVVVEAARRSGSLITARLANEQGRDVFAVPGSPLDPRAEGTNDLLRQGAGFCTSAADVIEPLEALRQSPRQGPPQLLLRFRDEQPLDLGALLDDRRAAAQDTDDTSDAPVPDARATLLALLGPAPLGLDDLVRLSGLPVGEVRMLLTELELAGDIDRRSDGLLSRAG